MVRLNEPHEIPTPTNAPFKQVVVVTPQGSLDHILDVIRNRMDVDGRVEEIEPFHWEDGGWALHLNTRRKINLSGVEGVERSFTVK